MTPQSTTKKVASRRGLRVLRTLLLTAALLVFFPRGWGALLGGALARRAVGGMAPGADLRVVRITPWQAEVAGLRLGSGPDAATCAKLRVRYSPLGLCRRRIEAVELRGLSVVAEAASNSIALAGLPNGAPPLGGGGGWQLERLTIDALRATLRLLPEAASQPPAHLVCELSAELRRTAPNGGAQHGGREWRLEVTDLRAAIVEAAGAGLDALRDWLPVEVSLPRGSVTDAGGGTLREWQLDAAGEVAAPRLVPWVGTAARHLRFEAGGSVSNLAYGLAVANLGGTGWGSVTSLCWRVGEMALRGTVRRGPGGGYTATTEIELTGGGARHTLGAVSNLHLRLPFTAGRDAEHGGLALAAGDAPLISWERAEAGGVRFLCDGFVPSSPRASALRMILRVAGSALTVEADCGFGKEGLTAALSIPAVALASDDALWSQLAGGWEGASILKDGACRVSGTLAAAASLALARGQEPRWRAEVVVTNGAAQGVAGQAWSVTGLATRVEAAGGRQEWRMAPATTRLGGARFGGLALDGGSVRWQWLDDELLVERAELAWCGGGAQFYGLRCDPRDPELECVLYLDRLDAGRLLALIKPLEGMATGHLYGRLPLRLRRGRVRLTDGFLFALPGERGNLQLRESSLIDDYLARSGLPAALRKQIGAALRNLDYHVLRFDLSAGGEPEARLGIKIEGESATDRKLPPVALDINIKGPLEALLNLGLQVNKGRAAGVE